MNYIPTWYVDSYYESYGESPDIKRSHFLKLNDEEEVKCCYCAKWVHWCDAVESEITNEPWCNTAGEGCCKSCHSAMSWHKKADKCFVNPWDLENHSIDCD